MPHKRAKRSARDRAKNEHGQDLAPSKQVLDDEPIPKSVSRVLNAAKVRREWKEKKRKRDEDGTPETPGKRQKTAGNLTIKPGESIQHFNMRVENDMRPLVKAAVLSGNALLRQARKARLRTQASKDATGTQSIGKGTTTGYHSGRAPQSTKSVKEFAQYSSSAPRRLNDIVDAPPDIKKLPRGAATPSQRGLGKRTGIVSMAQKQMMEQEREIVIARYRELKASRQPGADHD